MADGSPVGGDDDLRGFFDSIPVPGDLVEAKERVEAFVAHHRREGNKLALVTSGGTLVPLERRTVRYIENFSTGRRGSISAEEFISNGYAVIFLHRVSSLLPYHRIINGHSLDSYQVGSNGDVVMTTGDDIKPFLDQYKKTLSYNKLCMVGFTSLFEYLHYLRVITQLVNHENCIVYLAAAVSDYYIPPMDMEEHKISSTVNSLKLELKPVPKLLSYVSSAWSSSAFVISFKLETNEAVLVDSARSALRKYGHQLVIANCLETRMKEVLMVERGKEEIPLVLTHDEIERGVFIEKKLISAISRRHDMFCSESK